MINSGALTSPQGQVSLVSGRNVTLIPSTGGSDNGNNPNIRGLRVLSSNLMAGLASNTPDYLVQTDARSLATWTRFHQI